jgi:hypothetical protein
LGSAITTKGQATIPKAIREHLGFLCTPTAAWSSCRSGPPLSCAALSSPGGDGLNRRDEGGCGCRYCCGRTASQALMIGLDTNVVVRCADALIGALGAKVGCSHTPARHRGAEYAGAGSAQEVVHMRQCNSHRSLQRRWTGKVILPQKLRHARSIDQLV